MEEIAGLLRKYSIFGRDTRRVTFMRGLIVRGNGPFLVPGFTHHFRAAICRPRRETNTHVCLGCSHGVDASIPVSIPVPTLTEPVLLPVCSSPTTAHMALSI